MTGRVSSLPLVFHQHSGLAQRAMALGEALGIPMSVLLKDHPLGHAALLQPDATVTVPQLESILRNLLSQSGMPECGWLLGQRTHLVDVGLVGLALYHAPSLRDGLATVVRYPQLTAACFEPNLAEDAHYGQFEYLRPMLSADLHRFMAEYNVVSVISSFERLYPGQAQQQIVEVGFSFPMPAEGCPALGTIPVRYGQDREYVRFHRALLDVPMPGCDQALFSELARECERQAAALNHHLSLPQQVKQYLLQSEPLASLEETSEQFHMSERTLRRKLQQQGVSYRALRQAVIKERSLALLGQTDDSILQIAHRLGYEDSASFTRAFSKLQGIPPGQYRQQCLAGAAG